MVSRADFERREGGREREEGTISFSFFSLSFKETIESTKGNKLQDRDQIPEK